MKIAIVDDVSADRAQLIKYVEQYAKDNAVDIGVSEYESGEAFLAGTSLTEVDVIFLDIYLSGMSGMDLAYKIRSSNQPCNIVFVTTTSSFAVQSYDVQAFYYILKPYVYKDFSNVMSKLMQKMQKSPEYIKVKEGRDWCKILLEDILYVDYSNHYVQIHTESSIVSTYMKFPEMEEKLLVYKEFLNCYRCIVINMNKIKKVDELFFLLCNGEYIPINRKRVKQIKSSYMDYIFDAMEEGRNDDE